MTQNTLAITPPPQEAWFEVHAHLPGLLDSTAPQRTSDDRVIYILAHDDDWLVATKGTHQECMEQLALIQPQSVQDALDQKGWYVVPGRIWAQLKRRARHEARELLKEQSKPQPTAYQKMLKHLTTLFGSIRVFTYIPTILVLMASANSSQYSTLTWGCWVLANATMSASMYEANGRKLDSVVVVNIGNTVMCLVTIAFVAFYRLSPHG